MQTNVKVNDYMNLQVEIPEQMGIEQVEELLEAFKKIKAISNGKGTKEREINEQTIPSRKRIYKALTDDQKRKVRQMIVTGMHTMKEIAKETGLKKSYVNNLDWCFKNKKEKLPQWWQEV